tara:strand:- start:211 stop:384 length:174 start_codon:yes stop_codon:yes gene_type:complete
MVSNDLKKELSNKGIKTHIINKEIINLEKDGIIIELKISTIRKIFLNSLLTHIDNIT